MILQKSAVIPPSLMVLLVLEYRARGTPKTLKRKNTGKYRLRSKVTLGNTIK